MEILQKVFLIVYTLFSFYFFIRGYVECRYKANAYGLTPKLTLLGIFAWGDAVVFGIFWVFVALLSLILNDWILFCLVFSVFWVVRSHGETIYWFHQQFSKHVSDSNKPENMIFHWLFRNNSIWFIYQISWQVVTIVSIISSLYFAKLWFFDY